MGWFGLIVFLGFCCCGVGNDLRVEGGVFGCLIGVKFEFCCWGVKFGRIIGWDFGLCIFFGDGLGVLFGRLFCFWIWGCFGFILGIWLGVIFFFLGFWLIGLGLFMFGIVLGKRFWGVWFNLLCFLNFIIFRFILFLFCLYNSLLFK